MTRYKVLYAAETEWGTLKTGQVLDTDNQMFQAMTAKYPDLLKEVEEPKESEQDTFGYPKPVPGEEEPAKPYRAPVEGIKPLVEEPLKQDAKPKPVEKTVKPVAK